MRITAENGHYLRKQTYELSEAAIAALKIAQHAGEAESAFEAHTSHVPPCDRYSIWQAI